MEFLRVERACLAAFLPELADGLDAMPLAECERARGPAIELFRSSGGPGLLVPKRYHGRGASAVDAVRIQRAVAARAPSLAIASTMHHFSVATVTALAESNQGAEWLLLRSIADKSMLVASGFAEGRPGQHILKPALHARRVPGGFLVTGSKKPCSLTWSMDVLTASAQIPADLGTSGEPALVVLQISADSPGITRKPFWANPVLAGAESDEIVLTDVFVPEQLAVVAEQAGDRMDPVHTRGFVWFELLICASYLGIASGLAERVIREQRGTASERCQVAAPLETAMAALEGVAGEVDGGSADLGKVLLIRYGVQQAIEGASMHAAALAGGLSFITGADVGYLLAASRALAYHPPSFGSAAEALDGYLRGESITLA